MCEAGACVLRVVGRQPTARRDGKVIDDRSNAEGFANRLGGRFACFIDEAEAGGDDGIEESKRPVHVVKLLLEGNLRACWSREIVGGGEHVEIPRSRDDHGERIGGEERQSSAISGGKSVGGIDVGAMNGLDVLGHGGAHLLGTGVLGHEA